jgi:hypothetical protein
MIVKYFLKTSIILIFNYHCVIAFLNYYAIDFFLVDPKQPRSSGQYRICSDHFVSGKSFCSQIISFPNIWPSFVCHDEVLIFCFAVVAIPPWIYLKSPYACSFFRRVVRHHVSRTSPPKFVSLQTIVHTTIVYVAYLLGNCAFFFSCL